MTETIWLCDPCSVLPDSPWRGPWTGESLPLDDPERGRDPEWAEMIYCEECDCCDCDVSEFIYYHELSDL